jgi:hypothetical protein
LKIRILAMTLLAVIGFGCRERLSDGGTETTNGTVVGIAQYADGNLAAGARISLRPSRYLADINSSTENSGTNRLETRSDEQGRFQLSGIDPGEYAIEINDGKANAAWVSFEMSPSLEKVNLSSNTLLRTATLSGSLKSPGKLEGLLVYIRVFGLERKTFADRDGNFVLQDMPPGSYSLRINASSPYFDSVTLAENIVSSDSDTKVG